MAWAEHKRAVVLWRWDCVGKNCFLPAAVVHHTSSRAESVLHRPCHILGIRVAQPATSTWKSAGTDIHTIIMCLVRRLDCDIVFLRIIYFDAVVMDSCCNTPSPFVLVRSAICVCSTKTVPFGRFTGVYLTTTAREINKDKYAVTVVSPRNHFLFTPLLPSTAVGTLEFRLV